MARNTKILRDHNKFQALNFALAKKLKHIFEINLVNIERNSWRV